MRFPVAAGLAIAFATLLNAAPGPPETRLVDLNVVAVDKEGTPVDNLTIDDFLVSDGGKPQKIVFFHHVDGRPSSPPSPYPVPHEFSNRVATRTSHATVILFDLLNERMGTRNNAWSQLVRYLGSLKESDDLYLYLLTLDGRLFAVRGLTGAPAQSGETAESWTRQIKPLLDQAMTTVTRLRPVDIDVAVRVQLTYSRSTNTTLNVMSPMGVLMLVGIAASNSILKVEFAHRVERQDRPVDEAIISSCRVRPRPILMTSRPTIIGLAPIALKPGSQQYARSMLG